jgi:hypothetical protein
MTWEDKEVVLYTINHIIFDFNMSFDEKMQYANKLAVLDLEEDEMNEVCEYIDGINSEINILLHKCRHNAKLSTTMGENPR